MKKQIKFGPSGLGSVKTAIQTLEKYHKFGFKACEIAFTYGVYIKDKESAEMIGKKAKELDIQLSIHAPYWINLNSAEPEKIEKSKQRILKCLEVGTWLNAKFIVFHPGYYGKFEKKDTYNKIKKQIQELQDLKKQNKYTPELAPETTGKINVFGSINEIKSLVSDTKCNFCIDFAHILARYKDYKFSEIKSKFSDFNYWHIHFSGIEYSEKGEKRHKRVEKEHLKVLLKNLPLNKNFTIISESPFPIEDSVLGINALKEL